MDFNECKSQIGCKMQNCKNKKSQQNFLVFSLFPFQNDVDDVNYEEKIPMMHTVALKILFPLIRTSAAIQWLLRLILHCSIIIVLRFFVKVQEMCRRTRKGVSDFFPEPRGSYFRTRIIFSKHIAKKHIGFLQ